LEHLGFQHQALIYEGADDYLAGTVPFIEAALEADEPALVAVGPAQEEWLGSALGQEADGVRFLPMEEVGRNPASIIPVWRGFVDESAGFPMRGIGEPVWAARSPAALEECHRHEALLNVAFPENPDFRLLCPYDAGSLPEDVLERVGVSHCHVCRDGKGEASEEFDPGLDSFSGRLPPPATVPETFSFGLTGLAEVRGRAAAAAERAGMEPRAVADLALATSELAANSVLHGGGTGTLRLWHEDGTLLAEVEDRGRIEEPLVGRLRPGVSKEGGRGLWLANQLCDLVQIRSGDAGTVVRLHLVAPECAFV
jgi:anti-sigma regulatory factor (Ser/Thr protein kinase)